MEWETLKVIALDRRIITNHGECRDGSSATTPDSDCYTGASANAMCGQGGATVTCLGGSTADYTP